LLGDSVVNRLVCLIDYLSWSSSSTNGAVNASYWQKFLAEDHSNTSPYVTPHDASGNLITGSMPKRHVYPDWSKIILSGHSQGGGTAAFMAMTLPSGVRRVALFSAPQDNIGSNAAINQALFPNGDSSVVAAWIKGSTNTPLTSFWGLRNAAGGTVVNSYAPAVNTAEGAYGNNVWNNWLFLGAATSSYGLGGTAAQSVDSYVYDGGQAPTTSSGAATSSQKHYITAPNGTNLTNHSSSSVNVYTPANIATSWDRMFAGAGSD